MKSKILSLLVFFTIILGSISTTIALSYYGELSATTAYASVDNRPHMGSLGFKGYYEVKDINGLTKIIKIDTTVTQVMYSKTWNAPTHFQSKRLNVDVLVGGRFEGLIDKKR